MTNGVGARAAARAFAAGEPVVLIGGDGPDAEGELVIAAELASTENVAFLIRYGSGFVRAALDLETCVRLWIPPMTQAWPPVTRATAQMQGYAVAVDAREGVTTGISAGDRAHTLQVLADPASVKSDLCRPGHVQVVQTHEDGVLGHRGNAEAAVDLARIAGIAPAAAICAVVSTRNPAEMARRDELVEFAAEHNLRSVSITEIGRHRRRTGKDSAATAQSA